MPDIGQDAIWKITDVQTYLGQEVRNVYHYRALDQNATVTAAQVWVAWEAGVGNTLATAQSSALVHQTVEVETLGQVTGFGTFNSLVGAGAKGGTAMASFIAWSATLRRQTRETRDGKKRFAGLVEEDVTGNSIDPGAIGPYANVVNTLDQNILAGTTALQPVIIKVTKDPQTKQPLPIVQWIWNPVVGATSTFVLTTQNSRKLGVGI